MINTKLPVTPMTQQWISERFGMPTRGLPFGSTTPRSDVLGTSAFVATAGKRLVAIDGVVKGHSGVAICDLAYVPGTNAWSPPLC